MVNPYCVEQTLRDKIAMLQGYKLAYERGKEREENKEKLTNSKFRRFAVQTVCN